MTPIKVAERFYSLQGEGFWTGTPMCFVRTSQCPVGGQSGICTSWDGRKFTCDTGPAYKRPPGAPEWHSYTEIRESLDATIIWDWVSKCHSKHLVLTGGEPAVQDIADVVAATPWGSITHIETSGVVPLDKLQAGHGRLWVTLSPKEGWKKEVLPVVSEFKLLVDEGTTVHSIEMWIALAQNRPLYLQPIDEQDPEKTQTNTRRAVALCLALGCSLSVQVHKLLGVR